MNRTSRFPISAVRTKSRLLKYWSARGHGRGRRSYPDRGVGQGLRGTAGPYAGKITKLSVKVGDKLSEGDVVGSIDTDSAGGGDSEGDSDEDDEKEKADKEKDADKESEKEATSGQDQDDKKEEKGSDTGKQKSSDKKGGGSRKETVKVPALDGFEDVPVIDINVSEGDEVAEEDPLVTVESDKATMELPSPYAGRIEKSW